MTLEYTPSSRTFVFRAPLGAAFLVIPDFWATSSVQKSASLWSLERAERSAESAELRRAAVCVFRTAWECNQGVWSNLLLGLFSCSFLALEWNIVPRHSFSRFVVGVTSGIKVKRTEAALPAKIFGKYDDENWASEKLEIFFSGWVAPAEMKGIIDLYLEIPVLKICGFLYLTTEKEIPFYEIIIFFSSYKSKTKRIREKNWNFTRFLRHDEQ